MKGAIVIGVGPEEGLGARICKRFAGEGLHVLVAGRSQDKLAAIAKDITEAGGSAEAVVADATSEADIQQLFARADSLDLAVYNAGNNMPGRLADMDAEYFEACWRVGCFGGFLFGREAVRRFASQGTGGSLLFTGASASMRGKAMFGAFTAAKGGLRNLAQAFAKEYGPDGVHVGHVVVDGGIFGEKVKTAYPDYAKQQGEEGLVDIEGIVDAFQYLYRQPRNAWSFEVDLRTHVESW